MPWHNQAPGAANDDRAWTASAQRPCGGTAIVHSSSRITCSDPACADEERKRSPLVSHVVFVPCAEVLGAECPLCAVPDGRGDATHVEGSGARRR